MLLNSAIVRVVCTGDGGLLGRTKPAASPPSAEKTSTRPSNISNTVFENADLGVTPEPDHKK
jgi:hypothetical protein